MRLVSSRVGLPALLLLAPACGSSSHTGGDKNPIAATWADAGSSTDSSTVGATNDDASTDGGATDSGATTDAPGQLGADGAPPAPRCNPAQVWGSVLGSPLVPPPGFGRFGGIGVDELTIAWTSTTATISVADRATRALAFGTPLTIDTTSTPVAMDRVALERTGMHLFAVAGDRSRFVAFQRASMGAPWMPSTPLQFARIDAMASAEQGAHFSEPVLGADGTSFFYVLASATSLLPALYESTWDAKQGSWTSGVALTNREFVSASAASTTYATGASSDGRTLFFREGASNQERAAWRDSAASPFVQFADVPGIAAAAPNYGCSTLYFEGANSGGRSVFIAR